ncbi:PLP-dependent aminotransferase family protein [Olivibacter sp. SDN3]|uniref:aminotransferase-like domain-containing protein n=1 Tax=Olivibacter sp. SDN3 TaxID=2764720 RepID=UPI0016519F2F|nr:PLP-dependent aminotransferase family protein [Olivibacter sp. SDN3]QNL52306.1 PLP-dependent aminotransferase family protein [Olivibacter sp. SDN3]
MKKERLYLKIANIIEEQIANETLKFGDKLPSIRTVQKIYNVSMNTAKQAFLKLESKSLIEPRLREGYFVSNTSPRRFPLPSVGKLLSSPDEKPPDDLIDKVVSSMTSEGITRFSLGTPSASMLPTAKLNKGIFKKIRELNNSGTSYHPVQGSAYLRRMVSKWSMVYGGGLTENDLITTSGTMNALFHCLLAVSKPGDTMAVETPVFFGTIQIAKSLGLHVIEIPSHPLTGVDLAALKKVLHKITVCCFTTNFSNPLGSLMPDNHKKELVNMLAEYDIPLIEDDLYGNLFFGTERPKPCKIFDKAGIVMWCSSVSKTLAPGYRVGWVAPGRFKDKIMRHKLLQTISAPILYEEVIADFMEHGRYEHHLRNFRNRLYANCLHFQRAIEEYFPDNTKISQPQGGFVLWLELDERIDTAKLYDTAIRKNISFAPGRMFTLQERYHNCMRLSFALEWNDKLENDLKRLGRIVKNSL